MGLDESLIGGDLWAYAGPWGGSAPMCGSGGPPLCGDCWSCVLLILAWVRLAAVSGLSVKGPLVFWGVFGSSGGLGHDLLAAWGSESGVRPPLQSSYNIQ